MNEMELLNAGVTK